MKKVGIVTIFDLNNYGNRLQNYAMEQLLKKEGMEPRTIVLPEYDDTFKYSHKLSQIIKRVYSSVKKDNFVLKRYLNFLNFQKNMEAVVVNPKDVSEQYDFFVTGSDQVWHPQVINDNFLLKFADKNKRVAVSPSFGVSVVPENKKGYYKEGINNFAHVSVREDAGAKIIKELTNKDIPVLLDPVFMLDKSEWDKVARDDKRLHDRYLIKYILGEKDKYTEDKIECYAKENNLEIVNIYGRDSKYFSMGPAEFISAIKNSQLVCTNSFHALAFSLIYEKNFVVFNRFENGNDMNSRIDSLLRKFHMEHKKIENISEKVFESDFKEANSVLLESRKQFSDFIKLSLDK